MIRTSIARVGVLLAVVLGTVVLPVATAQACSCALVKPQQQFQGSDAVFTGTVANRDVVGNPPGGIAVYTVDVDSVYKGRVLQSQQVVTSANSASCGVALPVGDRVVIFADSGQTFPVEPRKDQLATRACSGSGTGLHVTSEFGTGTPPVGAPVPAAAPTPTAQTAATHWPVLAAAGLVVVLVFGGYLVLQVRRRSW